jgi:hypothetical protein
VSVSALVSAGLVPGADTNRLTKPCRGVILPPLSAKRFEDPTNRNADIAQLVEQVIRNDQVVGSNPTIGSSLRLGSNLKIQEVDNDRRNRHGWIPWHDRFAWRFLEHGIM